MSERTKRKAATSIDYNENPGQGTRPKSSGPKKPKTEKLPKFGEFEKTKGLKVTITTADGKKLFDGTAAPAEFNQRSYGFQAEGTFKMTITVDGKTQEVESAWTLSAPITGKVIPEANGSAK